VFSRLSFGLQLGSPVPAAIRLVKPTLVMILPVVVRCIVGIIPHTMKKELLVALDAALQEHTMRTQVRAYGIWGLECICSRQAQGYPAS